MNRYNFGFKLQLSPCTNNCCWAVCVEGEYKGYQNGLYIKNAKQWSDPLIAMREGRAAMEDEDFMAHLRLFLIRGYYESQPDCQMLISDSMFKL